MIRRYRWWLGGGALLLAVVVGAVFTLGPDGVTPPDRDRDDPGPPGTGPLTIVAMGDSTMSGEGAGDYTAETNGRGGNWCHRSPHAIVHQTDLPGVTETINLACSGAPSEQVALGDVKQYTEPSQAEQLAEVVETHQVVAIVVAVGANDNPQFSQMMNRCFEAWLMPSQPPCSTKLSKVFAERVRAMIPQVVNALNDIQLVLRRAGYEPGDTEIVLQSYASPVSPDIPESLRDLSGCPFHKQDLRWVKYEAVRTLSHGLRKAAARAGVRFLNMARAGYGHEACTGGADGSGEWFRRLTVNWNDLDDPDRASHAIQESFHPNKKGYSQMARCLTEFFAMEERVGACVVGKDGNLHAVSSLPRV